MVERRIIATGFEKSIIESYSGLTFDGDEWTFNDAILAVDIKNLEKDSKIKKLKKGTKVNAILFTLDNCELFIFGDHNVTNEVWFNNQFKAKFKLILECDET
jgi:hypothetical protein